MEQLIQKMKPIVSVILSAVSFTVITLVYVSTSYATKDWVKEREASSRELLQEIKTTVERTEERVYQLSIQAPRGPANGRGN